MSLTCNVAIMTSYKEYIITFMKKQSKFMMLGRNCDMGGVTAVALVDFSAGSDSCFREAAGIAADLFLEEPHVRVEANLHGRRA